MDITRGEATEKELDALIRRRHDHRVAEEGHRPSEEMWAESERRYFEEQHQAKQTARYEYHRDQAERLRRTMGELIARHEAAAEMLLENGHKESA